MSDYEERKFAIENVNTTTGERVRLMECYGEKAANAVRDRAAAALPDGCVSVVLPLDGSDD